MKNDKCLLLQNEAIDGHLLDYLSEVGDVFAVFDKQDSGCVSYGIECGGRNFFVKFAALPPAVGFLKQAIAFHHEARHPRIPKLLHAFRTGGGGLALVYEWVGGEVLHSPDFPGKEGRSRPESPHYRFRRLPSGKIIAALNAVYETHVYLESLGYVAVDFYDGCILYDFGREALHLCDFDHYARGPFLLEADRLFGSSRFMAPEEFIRGSRIDRRTNVFTMGAAAFVFLGNDGSRDRGDWRGSDALYRVASKAASPERDDRYDSVGEFYREWLKAADLGEDGERPASD
ncbi:serine/threonine protein kinase [Paenibacillus arenilitoris]|uniref:Serine/threonine protein kinase n=1 Tax=Paenibacillus arenilitoris TaxID=2772299 RepID=A0A927CID6_9BACL|nr:serine/threonine protein kinase [Paenibacillus arenilitoris]MBD2867188.1 serine/threonine protein kinase [Paenibacillus arenilitoris]